MMNVFALPDDLLNDKAAVRPDIIIYNYHTTDKSSIKAKVAANRHVFSFLQEGEKEVHFFDRSVKFTPAQALLIPASNCLMSERPSHAKQYRAFLFLFSDTNLAAFRSKYPFLFTTDYKIPRDQLSFFLFSQDEFVKGFIQSLQLLPNNVSPSTLSEHLLQIKFEEIMLYLCDRYPQEFLPLLASLTATSFDLPLRKVVESNVYTNLSMEELAFLCNMSLSTFKRKFEEVYGTPPARWFHLKKMQQAAFLLKHRNVKASEIHHKLGYENLSSFVQAFKKEFGKTPKVYQQSV
ncbi:helix-turn-helix domain-containing protein [Ohtaekwangia kribbensis]|jgi:AraC-like DNA-binding protein|uniref:Helix-turn-helix domain-containing protein n=1 Tax=Ohtaekwangia kribbensis TaxID=688913 RepID=A0ABW3KEK3_9BACT